MLLAVCVCVCVCVCDIIVTTSKSIQSNPQLSGKVSWYGGSVDRSILLNRPISVPASALQLV